MKEMRRLRLLFAVLMAVVLTPRLWAQTFTYSSHTYEVIYGTQKARLVKLASGTISCTVPSSVTYNGTTYAVTEIGDFAACDCRNSLQAVVLSSPVEKISANAFELCKNLSSINLDKVTKEIGENAFWECEGLTTLSLSSLKIGKQAFAYCEGLMSLSLSSCTLGEEAFRGCPGLTSLSLTNIGEIPAGCFAECDGLSCITLPSSLYYIGERAFQYCFNIKDIYCMGSNVVAAAPLFCPVDEGVVVHVPCGYTEKYRSLAGWRDTGLTFEESGNITLNVSAGRNGRSVMILNSTGSQLGSIPAAGGSTTLTMEKPESIVLQVPKKHFSKILVNGVDVTSTLSSTAHGDFTDYIITDFVAENNIHVAYEDFFETNQFSFFFYGNEKIKTMVYLERYTATVVEPGTAKYIVTDLLNQNFANTSQIELHLYEEETYPPAVYHGGVDYSSRLEWGNSDYLGPYYKIIFSKDEIVSDAFAVVYQTKPTTDADRFISFEDAETKRICVENWDTDQDGELSVAEAAAVTQIGDVFNSSEIEKFDEFRYFTGVTSLEGTFRYCWNLSSITLPQSLQTIGANSFDGCTALRHIVLPDMLTTIGEDAFMDCSSLIAIHIPENVTSIGVGAFSSCSALMSISVDEFNTQYRSSGGCDAILVNSSGTTILLAGCKYTRIPQDVSQITTNAFAGCNELTEIELPSGVRTIQDGAFEGCTSLTRVVARMKTPPSIAERYPFDYGMQCTLVVPAGTRAAYIAAGWTEEIFGGGIVEMTDGGDLEGFVWNNTEAGSLYAELSTYPDDQLKAITRLTVNSPINSADLFMIRKLCGDYANDPTGYTDYGLEMLDLTNATIVADYGTGTVPYSSSLYIRNNDELPENMLSQCKNLAEVKLPSSASLTASANIFQGAKADMIVHAPWADAPALTILPFADPLCAAFGQKSSTAVAGMTLVVPQGTLTAYEAADGWNWFNEIREESDTEPESLKGDLNGDGRVSIADVTKLVNIVLGK